MPLELQVIRANEFLRLDAQEHLDFAASKKTLQELAHACRKRGLDRALLDLRALPVPEKPLFTPAQLAALVDTFREAGFGRHQRLAILYRIDPHGGARLFAFIGRIRGWQVRAFAEFEEALHWLSDMQADPRKCEGGEVPITIGKQRGGARKLPVAASGDGGGGKVTPRPGKASDSLSRRAIHG
jgi:hypothetical protein